MKKPDSKGISLNEVIPIGITLIVIGVSLSVGTDVLTTFEGSQCPATSAYDVATGECQYTGNTSVINTSSFAFNASRQGTEGLIEFAGWQDTWAVVIALAVIVGVLGFLSIRRN